MNNYHGLLKSIYYNTKSPAAFSSAKNLYSAAKEKNSFITQNDVNDWLQGEFTYTLHKPVRRNYKRNPIIVEFPNEQWQADLADMREFKSHNNGYQYILTVIDVFSKYAWAIPVKNKTATVISKAFDNLFEESKPIKLQTDEGGEFDNKLLKNLLAKHDIVYFTAKNKNTKCAVVERFNRTLKSKMFKYFTSKGTRRYLDVLPDLVESYNNSYHQSIKEKPINVNESNEKLIFYNLYGVPSKRHLLMRKIKKPSIAKADKVRIKYKRGAFDKGFYPNWTDQIYTISNAIKGIEKPVYKLESETKKFKRNFYPEEIQKVNAKVYRVEKILKTRKRKRKIEYFVKWLNYPSSENSWITSKDLITL